MDVAALIKRLTGPGQRLVAVPRGMLIAGGGALLVLALWAAATIWFVLFRDDVTAALMARHSSMQQAYEDRIGALRTHLDRLASQNLLDQDGLDKRLAEIAARQGLLETRQAFLARLSDRWLPSSSPAGLPPEPSVAAPAVLPSPAAQGVGMPQREGTKPMPVPEAFDLRLREPKPDVPSGLRQRTSHMPATLRDRIAGIERSLDAAEERQMQVLDRLARTAETRASRLRDAIREAGLDPLTREAPRWQSGLGGPLVPASGAAGHRFEAMLDRAQTSLESLGRLDRAVTALPFASPIPGDLDPTSGFGYRIDPFTRGPAIHTGLDFRAEYGAPVRASGAGQVVAADYAGGYGNMVEIDHGHGVSSRYAHLSVIAVAAGQALEAGAVLGRAGSTGRSTGPHLHYETRIDGEAVDPQRFLQAGTRLETARQTLR